MEFTGEEYKYHKLLATGRNGSSMIFEVTYKDRRCALKRIVVRTADDLLLADRERDLLVYLNSCARKTQRGSRFLVNLQRAVQTSPIDLHLIFPFACGGDLFEQRQLRPGQVFTELEARHYLAELSCALKYLHVTCGVVHRDIKTENVLLDTQGHVLLADFDLSRRCGSQEVVRNEVCGTFETVAPECVPPRCESSFASDIYALGMLGLELVLGVSRKIPDDATEEQVFKLIASGEREHAEGRTSDQFARFINHLLAVSPGARPLASHLAGMPFFDAVNEWEAVEWQKVLRRSVRPPELMPCQPSVAGENEDFGVWRSDIDDSGFCGRWLPDFKFDESYEA